MPFPPPINEALENYDKNKGPWRRLFRFDQAAIRALRRLSEADQINFLKIDQCFIENKPKNTQESFKVYDALLNYLETIDFSGIPEIMQQLHISKLLKPDNLDKLTPLKGNQFYQLAILLFQLKKQNLLTQVNFDNIAQHFETSVEHKPEEFQKLNYVVEAVKILDFHLTQENFNLILKQPMLVGILTILHSNLLLNSDNCSDIFNGNNQFLLSEEAYNLVWLPFKAYLSTLDLDEKQWTFDRLIRLMQKENPEEKIKKFMTKLNSEGAASTTQKKSTDKFFTAPPQRSKSRGSLHDLVSLAPDRPGGTL